MWEVMFLDLESVPLPPDGELHGDCIGYLMADPEVRPTPYASLRAAFEDGWEPLGTYPRPFIGALGQRAVRWSLTLRRQVPNKLITP